MHRAPSPSLGAHSPSRVDFSPRTLGTPCSSRRISMGEVTKARGTSTGGVRGEWRRRRKKKKEPRWRHTSSVFSGLPPVLLANSSFSFSCRPSPVTFSLLSACLPLVPSRFWRVLRPPSRRFLFYFAPLLDPHPAGPPISSATAPYCGKKTSKGRSQNAKLG